MYCDMYLCCPYIHYSPGNSMFHHSVDSDYVNFSDMWVKGHENKQMKTFAFQRICLYALTN